MLQHELLELAATDEDATELLSWSAWVFVIGTDFRSRTIVKTTQRPMTGVLGQIEDLAVKVFVKRKAAGETYGIEDWISLLEPPMGAEASERYEYICSGMTMLLPIEVFGAKTHCLEPVKQEILEFGMDRKSFKDGVVRGLKEGSRAEEAGLRDGVRILWSSHAWRCVDYFEAMMEIVVER